MTALNNIGGIVEQERFIKLPISLIHAEVAGQLHDHHRDLFDPMLVAQAQGEGLAILTADEKILRYGMPAAMATL